MPNDHGQVDAASTPGQSAASVASAAPPRMSSSAPDVEARTQQVGRDLFARARRLEKSSPSDGWLDRTLMRWGMRDEQLKAQLFRFVDVLPVLDHPRRINAHIREYLTPVRDRLPMLSGRALRFLPDDGWLGRRVADLARSNARRMARRFIAARDLPGAIKAVQDLRRKKLTFTIDLLGEAVLSAVEAERYQGEYLKLVEGLSDAAKHWPMIDQVDRDGAGGIVPRLNVSVKLSSLYSHFDPI